MLNKTFIICAVAGLLTMGCVGGMDESSARENQALYCEMVALFEQTNGQQGWPDYKGIAQTVCPSTDIRKGK